MAHVIMNALWGKIFIGRQSACRRIIVQNLDRVTSSVQKIIKRVKKFKFRLHDPDQVHFRG